jgi:ribose transport system ATP-binding protein
MSGIVASPALTVRGVSKRFGGTQALDGVSLEVGQGEIHGLLGENGCGKSTLIKILAGYHTPEEGSVMIHGTEVRFPLHEDSASHLGMTFVHQDLALVPSLSVIENLLSGDLATRNRWRINWRRERQRARRVFERYGLDVDPGVEVATLTPVERAMVAIVRAVEEIRERQEGGDGTATPSLLILDEPTVFLPRSGTDRLFELLREHVRQGGSVLFVSHDLDEVREITDHVTVLRDGRVSATAVTSELSRDDLIELIVGRKAERAVATQDLGGPSSDVVASVRELRSPTMHSLSFDVHGGEIVGLAGLPGSGFDDVPYALFGVRPGEGELAIEGETLRIERLTPYKACCARMALIPADRKTEGAAGSLTVAENVTSLVLDSYRKGPMLNVRAERRDAAALVESFDVRPRATEALFGSLSGGNQQKALLGKWLRMSPRLLLLHEPTQGVDVGAREQIWQAIRESARRDSQAVLCASTDHEQLERLCDRVLVFAHGRIVASVERSNLRKENISEACYGR